jgi:uncharacterized membrane protein YkoI
MKTYLIPLVAAVALVAGCNRSIESASQEFNTLPRDVQKTIRAEAPTAEIANISERTDNGTQVFEITFREPDMHPAITVAADGRLVSGGGTSKKDGVVDKVERALTPTGAVGTKFSALPQEVQKAIQAQAPAGEIADISRRETDGRVYYEVEFKDQGKNPTMRIGEDGTLIQDLQK